VRYPWIAEAALKTRQKRFLIDGEAVIPGVDGIRDFNALQADNTTTRCSFPPSIFSPWTAIICGPFPSTCGKQICSSYWRVGRMASASRRSSAARSGPTYSRLPAAWGLKA